MTVVQKSYWTIESHHLPKFDSGSVDPPHEPGDPSRLLTSKAIAIESFPLWFANAPPKFKKVVRILGCTVNWVDTENFLAVPAEPLNQGFRLFSNIVTNSNIVMKTTVNIPTTHDFKSTTEKEGFVMMVNNYNSAKEYDITYENIREIQFFLRPWHTLTDSTDESPVDFVCELELLLIDDS